MDDFALDFTLELLDDFTDEGDFDELLFPIAGACVLLELDTRVSELLEPVSSTGAPPHPPKKDKTEIAIHSLNSFIFLPSLKLNQDTIC